MNIEMQTQKINDILYKHDLVHTCCNVNEDMELEYWSIADTITQDFLSTNEFSLDILRDTLLEAFEVDESILDYDAMVKAQEEIEATIDEAN